jgi:TonB family protein
MKKCIACGEVFGDNFSFCPIDGRRLALPSEKTRLLQLTLIEEARLIRRLAIELAFLGRRIKECWPLFRKDPVAFTKSKSIEMARYVDAIYRRPYAKSGLITALGLVVLLILTVALLEKRLPNNIEAAGQDDLERVSLIELSNEPADKTGSGIGAGEEGRVGFNKGKGEGSNPKPARAQGGGSGGMQEQLPPSEGRPPVASPIPAPITRTYARLPSLPEAGIDLDPALWRKLDLASYGDPRSKSTNPSNGPGEGGGIGTGKGTGIGEGDGPGFGPGRNGNMGGGDNSRGSGGKSGSRGNEPGDDPDRVYKQPEVSTRPVVLSKPEPQYTEAARRNGTTGMVVLRAVFSSSGEVTNIQVVQKLGDGLTEKAIAAAKQIRFVPAKRDGRPVSMYMQLQYNFNLY